MKQLLLSSISLAVIAGLTGCSTSYDYTPFPTALLYENLHDVSEEDLKNGNVTISIISPDNPYRIYESKITINDLGDYKIHQGENMNYIAQSGLDSLSFYGMGQLKDGEAWTGFAGGVRSTSNNLDTLTGKRVTYTGTAMGMLNRVEDDIDYGGKINLTVDFGAGSTGTVTGTITGNELAFGPNGINIDAYIADSIFEGKVTLHEKGLNKDGEEINNLLDQGKVWGQFNGEFGNELSGHYDSDKPEGMAGSFTGGQTGIMDIPKPDPTE